MADDRIFAFDANAARNILTAARRVLGAPGPGGAYPERYDNDIAIYLCKASAYIANGATGAVDLYSGATKGSETDTGINVDVYVRHGIVLSGQWLLAIEVDGAFEVLTPSEIVIGKTDAAHNKAASGTVSVWSGSTVGSETDTTANITVWNRFANVASSKWVKCQWNYDSKSWDIIAAEC